MTEENPDNHYFTFEDGDIKLLATFNGRPIIGKVRSIATAYACKAWKNFLYPPWGGPVTELDFTEDNGPALLVLLRITHLKFEGLDDDMYFDLLHRVAVLCDKYQCADLVKPWLYIWAKDWEREGLHDSSPRVTKWLKMAWILGLEDVLRTASANIITYLGYVTRRNGTWKLIVFGTGHPKVKHIPPVLLEQFLRIRQGAIQEVLEIICDLADTILDEGACSYRSQDCNAKLYGSLVWKLNKMDLWPRKSPGYITECAHTSKGLLSSFSDACITKEGHQDCSWTETFKICE